MLRQGADAQLHRAQLIEVRDELRCGDADEARREAALRHEGLLGAGGDGAHRAGDLDVLGEIEVVGAGLARRLRDRRRCSSKGRLEMTASTGCSPRCLRERAALRRIQGEGA